MAFLTKNVFGDISGKVGNTVVRIRYGKEVVYSKPSITNISYSDKAVAGRAKFAHTVKLARLINSNPDLSTIWKSAKIKGTNAYQKIIKHNAGFTTPEGLTINNIISPPGLEIFKSSLIVDENFIKLESEVELKSNFSLTTAYMLFVPLNVTGEYPFLIPSSASFIEGNKVQCKFQLEKNQSKIFLASNIIVLLITFIFKDNSGKINCWSDTINFLLPKTAAE